MLTTFIPGQAVDVELEVRRIAALKFDIPLDAVRPDAAFIEDLGADSLDAMEVVMAMEEAFLTEIPDVLAEEIVTVSDAARLMVSLLPKMDLAPCAAPAPAGSEPLPC